MDSDSFTPLMLAARDGNIHVVKALLEAKADVTTQTMPNGNTAIMHASGGGHTDVIHTLLAANSAAFAATGTATGTATVMSNADDAATATDAANATTITTATVTAAAASVRSMRNSNNDTPLMFAAMSGHLSSVSALIEAGSDVKARNKLGECTFFYRKLYFFIHSSIFITQYQHYDANE
jgi:ankyrin repeat protein